MTVVQYSTFRVRGEGHLVVNKGIVVYILVVVL